MLRRLNNENPRINCDTSVFVLFLVMGVLSQSHRTHRRPQFFKHKTNVPSSVPLDFQLSELELLAVVTHPLPEVQRRGVSVDYGKHGSQTYKP